MSSVESLENKGRRQQQFMAHVEKFIQTLGDPSTWVFDGEVIDLGRMCGNCLCGHPIRYEFIIHSADRSRQAIVGSECIEHFQSYNPGLFEALKKADKDLHEKIRAARKAAKEAKDSAEAQALAPAYDAIVARIKAVAKEKRTALEARQTGYGRVYLPHALWKLELRAFKPVRQFQRSSSLVKFYKRETVALEDALADYQEGK